MVASLGNKISNLSLIQDETVHSEFKLENDILDYEEIMICGKDE